MGKRKEIKDGDDDVAMTDVTRRQGAEDSGDDSDSSSEMDTINVDFEWFDPQPEYDFHGLKILLRQLFDVDAQLFDLSALADMILAQPLLGSTVKVDGNETDPYAFLTVLNLKEHKDKPAMKQVIQYLQKVSSSRSSLSPLSDLLSRPNYDIPPIGLILTERLINVPPAVVPPMYTMLQEEIQWALEDKEPYEFTHYLIISKTYQEVESKLDMQESRPQKKQKKKSASSERFYFHPEDEILERHALCFSSFDYTIKQDEGLSDSKRAFQDLGIRPQGSLILIDASKFEDAVKEMSDVFKPPA
ncbi:hypothetical protein VTN49DRAFT_1133 [Thermomyces lanuginosus]|uniref:uncharacterized protein n=1 Tax=Thermomyces lanuginosus TaxID=5541 RepID=UPI003742D396